MRVEDLSPETEFIVALNFAHLPLSLIPCPSCSYKTPATSMLGQICVHGFGGVGYHVLENFALMLMIIRRCSPEKIPGVFERAIERGRSRGRERETEADVHTKHIQTARLKCTHINEEHVDMRDFFASSNALVFFCIFECTRVFFSP